MTRCFVRQTNGRCRVEHVTASSGGNESLGVVIAASVGAGAVNRSDDVLAIQDGLNRLEPEQGRPQPELKLDGICGPKTLAAIRQFQAGQCGFKWPDARVDPGGKTNRRLDELLDSAQPTAPTARRAPDGKAGTAADLPFNPYIEPWMLTLVPVALMAVRAAQHQLSLAWPVIARKDVSAAAIGAERAASAALVNLHFEVDKSWGNRQNVVDGLIDIYRKMSSVFVRPGNLWGSYIFADDPYPKKHTTDLAYTFCGGYYLAGQWNPRPYRQRLDTVYFCEQLATKDRTNGIITIVHELAHFVGSPNLGRDIVDFDTYGWVTEPQMKKLQWWQRIRHAESFANFAVDSLP